MDFFNLVFFQRLVASTFATIFGVGLGGWWALRRNRRSERNAAQGEEKKAEDELRKRRIQALQAAKGAISNNADRIKNLVTLLKSGEIAYFNVDPKELDYLIPELLKTHVDLELFRKINTHRRELEHRAREIDTRYEMICHPAWANPNRLGEIIKSINARCEFLILKVEEIEKIIDGRLKKEEVN